MTPDESPVRYTVDLLDGVSEQLQANQRQAAHDGYGRAHVDALKRVDAELAASAGTFGEALYDLPNAQLQVRRAVVRPVVVVYGVHYRQPRVFVRTFSLLPPSIPG